MKPLLALAMLLTGCAVTPPPPAPRTATLTWHGVSISYTLPPPSGK